MKSEVTKKSHYEVEVLDSPCARWPLGRTAKLLGLPVKVTETDVAHCLAEALCHGNKES